MTSPPVSVVRRLLEGQRAQGHDSQHCESEDPSLSAAAASSSVVVTRTGSEGESGVAFAFVAFASAFGDPLGMPGLESLHASADLVEREDHASWDHALLEAVPEESLAYGHFEAGHLVPAGPAKEVVKQGSVVELAVAEEKHY
jgi:hypothetical protein